MPRDYRASENQKMAKARRSHALARNELRQPTVPRVAPAGATSAPIKASDPETARMVDEFLSRRKGE